MNQQTIGFQSSNNVVVSGLTSLNSQMFHVVINGCNNVKLKGVKVLAAGNSPNTDGIHVQSSSIVSIFNTKISTGDDCVSIGPGTNGLWIENVACGPGHGIRYMYIYYGFFSMNYKLSYGEIITHISITYRKENTSNK